MSAVRSGHRGRKGGRKKSAVESEGKPPGRRPKWARVHREEEVLSWRRRPLRTGTGNTALRERRVRQLSFRKTAVLDTADEADNLLCVDPVASQRIDNTSHSASRDTSCVTFASSVSTSSLHAIPPGHSQSATNDTEMSAIDDLRVNGFVDVIMETTSPESPSDRHWSETQQRKERTSTTIIAPAEKSNALEVSKEFFRAYDAFRSDDPVEDREWLSYFAESHWPTSCEELWRWPPVVRCFKPIQPAEVLMLQLPPATANKLQSLLASPCNGPYAWQWLVQDARRLVQFASNATWVRKELCASSPSLMTDPMQAAAARAKHNHRRGIVCEACVLRNRMRAQQLSSDKPKLAENDITGEAPIFSAYMESQSAVRSGDQASNRLDDDCRGAGPAHPVFFKPVVLFLGSGIQSAAAKGDGLRNPIKTDRGGTVERSCDVCMSTEQSKENWLWRCHGCGTVVHQACYGISERMEQTERPVDTKWLCRPCEQTYAHAPSRQAASALRKSIRCSLCGAATGALKPASNGAWAHIFCALCAPDTSLEDMRTMEPIVGLDKIPAHRRHLRCVICHKSTGCGGVIRCHWADCNASFHASCGRRGGYLFLISERESLQSMLKQTELRTHIDERALEKHGPVVALCFCREHTRKALNRLSLPLQQTSAVENLSVPAPERLRLDAGQPAVTHEYELSPRKIRELHKRNELRPYLRTLRMRVMSGLEALEKAKQRFKHIHSNGFSCQACLCRSVSRKLYDALCRFNRIAASFETRRGAVVGGSPAMVSAQRLGAIMGEIEQVLAHQASAVCSEKREVTDRPSVSENESNPDAVLMEEAAPATTNAVAWLSRFVHFEESDHNHDDAIDSANSSRVADTTKTGDRPTISRLRFRMMIDQSGIAIEGEYGWPKSGSATAHEPSSLEARDLVLLWYRVVPADTPTRESDMESERPLHSSRSPLRSLLCSKWEQLAPISMKNCNDREMLARRTAKDRADRAQLARLEQEQEACVRRLRELSALRSGRSDSGLVVHHNREETAPGAMRPPRSQRHGGLARLESCPPQSMAELEADLALHLMESERAAQQPGANETIARLPCSESPVAVDTRMLLAMNARCDVCGGGDCDQAGNDIILCDRCGVGVHQQCYGVAEIPPGDWFCDACQLLVCLESDTQRSA